MTRPRSSSRRSPPRRARSRERRYDNPSYRSRSPYYSRSPSPRPRPRTRTPLPVPPPPAPAESRAIPRPPTPPSFSASSPQKPELTSEQLKSLHLADGITGRQLLTKIDADIASNRKFVDSTRFPSLGDDGKERLDAELTQLEAKREQQKKRHEDAITQLIKLNSWPSLPPTEAQEAEREKQEELLRYIKLFEQAYADLNALLDDIKKSNNLAPSSENITSDDPRPLKRRRLSDSQAQPEPISGPTIEDLEAVHDKILELEGRFSALQNDMYSHEQETLEEMESKVEQRLEQYAQSFTVEPPAGQETLNEVKEGLDTTGKEVEELAEEVSKLMLLVNAQKEEMEDIKGKIKDKNVEFTQMQAQFKNYIGLREKDHKTITALEAALQVHISSSPAIPTPQFTHDQLIELMQEPLSDIVRANVQPLVEQLRTEVQEMLYAQNQEMYKNLPPTMRMTKPLAGHGVD